MQSAYYALCLKSLNIIPDVNLRINGTKISEELLNYELKPAVLPKCPEAFAKLMRRCWESDPSKRRKFKEGHSRALSDEAQCLLSLLYDNRALYS